MSGQLTNLHRARTCQGSLRDPDEVSCSFPHVELHKGASFSDTSFCTYGSLASNHSGVCLIEQLLLCCYLWMGIFPEQSVPQSIPTLLATRTCGGMRGSFQLCCPDTCSVPNMMPMPCRYWRLGTWAHGQRESLCTCQMGTTAKTERASITSGAAKDWPWCAAEMAMHISCLRSNAKSLRFSLQQICSTHPTLNLLWTFRLRGREGAVGHVALEIRNNSAGYLQPRLRLCAVIQK